MDNQYNQYNQQTGGDPYQQGNPYQQQGNPYQQQGNPYQQQGNPYQQQGNPYQQQGNPYQQQGNPYQQGNGYGNYGSGNTEPQKAPNIFQQFALAFVPTKYDRLTKVSTGSMIGFVTLLVFIVTTIIIAFFALAFSALDLDDWIGEMPDFTITGGRLYIDEDFMYDEDGVFVYMTEDIDEFSYDDAMEIADEGYQEIILVGRDQMSIMQAGSYQQMPFSAFDGLEISRDWFYTLFSQLIWLMLFFWYLLAFVGGTLWYFLAAAVYLLFAMLIATIMKKQIETGALFRVAVYAKVLMFMVATVLNVVSFVSWTVPFLLRVAITIGFMAFAIAKLPDNRPAPMPMGPGMGQWGQGGQNGQGWQ